MREIGGLDKLGGRRVVEVILDLEVDLVQVEVLVDHQEEDVVVHHHLSKEVEGIDLELVVHHHDVDQPGQDLDHFQSVGKSKKHRKK